MHIISQWIATFIYDRNPYWNISQVFFELKMAVFVAAEINESNICYLIFDMERCILEDTVNSK